MPIQLRKAKCKHAGMQRDLREFRGGLFGEVWRGLRILDTN